MQIADYICENILTQTWKPDEKILSVREMAATIEVNPNTVARTYSHLQDLGVIYNKRGIGYFVAEDGLEKTRDLRKTEFVKEDLPEVFRNMDLLDMSISDLEKYYTSRSNGHSHNHQNNENQQ